MKNSLRTILGIDPGSRITGYGIIHTDGHRHSYVACGRIVLQAENLAEKLREIFHHLSELIKNYKPQEAAIEQVFMARNANSALKLGQARGAAIVAMANQGLSVEEYSARAIKKAVVGYGGADKQQVQHMIRLLLNLNKAPAADAADALAIAICHAHSLPLLK